MTNALSIAVPALALVIVLAVPGEPRWTRRPWFIKSPLRRSYLAAFFALLLVVSIIRTAS